LPVHTSASLDCKSGASFHLLAQSRLALVSPLYTGSALTLFADNGGRIERIAQSATF
jgi:hypothetical protein